MMKAMTPETQHPRRNRLRTMLVLAVSVFMVGFIFRLTEAGSLTPSALPAATMQTLEDIFNPLAGTYDSADVSAFKGGNAFEMTKCIIARMKGNSEPNACPTSVFQLTPIPIARNGLAVALRNPVGSAFVRWRDAGISHTRTALSYKLNQDFDSAPEVEGGTKDVSLPLDCTHVGTFIADVWACNGSSHCDFAVTFFDVQDNIGACPGPLAGSFPMIVGVSATSIAIDVTDTASVSWDDIVLNTEGTITNYKARKDADPFVTSLNPDVTLQFDCTDYLNTPITTEWHACDGTDCNFIQMSVDVQDSFANCP